MLLSRLSFALEKNELQIPHEGKIAVFRAVAAPDHPALPKPRLRVFNSFRPAFDRLLAQAYEFASAPAGEFESGFAVAIVNITRSKAETLGLLAHAVDVTSPGGLIMVDGSKTDGIDSILKRAKAAFTLCGSAAKSHGKLFWFNRPKTLPEVLTHWRMTSACSENAEGFQTAPGMFSPDKIDNGSKLLAANFDEGLRGKIADLGAGWGWLALQALNKGNPDSIDLFEAEKLALDAARLNVNDARARFHWADVETIDAGADYDAVISNPPFHQGRSADYSLGAAFIAKAARMLKPRGCFWLVANRHLPYESYLDAGFSHWESVEQTPYFKVLRANNPRSTSSRNKRNIALRSR